MNKIFVAYTYYDCYDSGITRPLYVGTNMDSAKKSLWRGDYFNQGQEVAYIAERQIDTIETWIDGQKVESHKLYCDKIIYDIEKVEISLKDYLTMWDKHSIITN